MLFFCISSDKCVYPDTPIVRCNIDIRNTGGSMGPQYSPRLLYWPRPIGLGSVWWPWGVLWPKYCLWGVSYFYYPTIPIFQCLLFCLHCIMTSLKYSFLNTPKQQYFMLLTSGGKKKLRCLSTSSSNSLCIWVANRNCSPVWLEFLKVIEDHQTCSSKEGLIIACTVRISTLFQVNSTTK